MYSAKRSCASIYTLNKKRPAQRKCQRLHGGTCDSGSKCTSRNFLIPLSHNLQDSNVPGALGAACTLPMTTALVKSAPVQQSHGQLYYRPSIGPE